MGIICSKTEMMELYQQDPDDFVESIHPSARDLDDKQVILGQDSEDLEENGVLINDGAKPNNIKPKLLRAYIKKSQSKANVEIIHINGELFYQASKNIKSGSELYAHYGVGYWLLAMNVPAQKIPQIVAKL